MILRSPLTRIAAALTVILVASSIEPSGSATSEAVPGAVESSQSSARVIVETGTQISARPLLIRQGIPAYERLSLAKHRVSLVLSRADSVEWGFTVTHMPEPDVTLVGATAHIPIKPEIRVVIQASGALMTHPALQALLPETLWGVGLEWKGIADPLAISAAIDYSSSASGDVADASIRGSVSLLLTDTISLSLSASVSGICQSSLNPELGISLASRTTPQDTVYARVDASLAPADSVCISVGAVRELQ